MSERRWEDLEESEKAQWLHDAIIRVSGKVNYLLDQNKELAARLQVLEAKRDPPQ